MLEAILSASMCCPSCFASGLLKLETEWIARYLPGFFEVPLFEKDMLLETLKVLDYAEFTALFKNFRAAVRFSLDLRCVFACDGPSTPIPGVLADFPAG